MINTTIVNKILSLNSENVPLINDVINKNVLELLNKSFLRRYFKFETINSGVVLTVTGPLICCENNYNFLNNIEIFYEGNERVYLPITEISSNMTVNTNNLKEIKYVDDLIATKMIEKENYIFGEMFDFFIKKCPYHYYYTNKIKDYFKEVFRNNIYIIPDKNREGDYIISKLNGTLFVRENLICSLSYYENMFSFECFERMGICLVESEYTIVRDLNVSKNNLNKFKLIMA